MRFSIFSILVFSTLFAFAKGVEKTRASTIKLPKYTIDNGVESVDDTKISVVGQGWARNSVNAVVFRKNSLASHEDTQFVAYYDAEGYVVLGKRKHSDSSWTTKRSQFKGNVRDAHNSISIMVDGDGYLHIAWDHHNNPLNYTRSISPGSLEMGNKEPMTGKLEQLVTYPEFFKRKDGSLLFMYRDGESGKGNLVISEYSLQEKTWKIIHENLIDGEGKRNAYPQATIDKNGTIHLSWVWRSSPDVASNQDMCYARSFDGGHTWQKTTGEQYTLPITFETAEYAAKIPQNSELINQTSMAADDDGNPVIASYWTDIKSGVPQYHLIYLDRNKWKVRPLAFRKQSFSLSGEGTKSIPISRPQVLVSGKGKKVKAWLLFRDEERGSKVSLVEVKSIRKKSFIMKDVHLENVGSWEPTFDTVLWEEKRKLHVFVQKVTQVDSEGIAELSSTEVKVLEIGL